MFLRSTDRADTARPTLLAVFAHPDDESFAVGGTLAKYAAEGVEVVIVSATRGETGIRGVDASEAAALREAELRGAAAELGVSRVVFLGYPDGGLADIDPDGAVSRLMALLRELRPQVVITFGPDGISGHPDHVTVSRWVTAAFDELDGAGSPQKLYYVAPSLATQQGCGVADPPPLPPDALGVDVEPYLEAKVRAMQAHASQDPPYVGDPAQEAEKMACHEWFVLARPCLPLKGNKENGLFGQLVG
jgi:LmbE family N-acetylglucosaminyl deacetylase